MMNMNFPTEPGIGLRFPGHGARPIRLELRSPKASSATRFHYVIWPVAAFMITFALATASATILWVIGSVALLALGIAVCKSAPSDSDNAGLSELLAASP